MARTRKRFTPFIPPPGAPSPGVCLCGRPAWRKVQNTWCCEVCRALEARITDRGGAQRRRSVIYVEPYRVLL